MSERVIVEVGKRLRQLRLQRGMTQRELAERVEGGMDLSYIGKIERGEQNPSLKMLQKLGKVLEVPVDTFFASRLEGSEGTGQDALAGHRAREIWEALQRVPDRDLPFLAEVISLAARRYSPSPLPRGGQLRSVPRVAESAGQYAAASLPDLRRRIRSVLKGKGALSRDQAGEVRKLLREILHLLDSAEDSPAL